MKLPSYIPIMPHERSKREKLGLFLEALLWGFAVVGLIRQILAKFVYTTIERLAYGEPPVEWALSLVQSIGYDSRDPEFSWPLILVLFAVGALIGVAVGLTGRGCGHLLASLSKMHVYQAEDSVKIYKYWRYARIEGLFFLGLAIAVSALINEVDFSKVFDSDGLASFSNLALHMSCGIPLVGTIVSGALDGACNVTPLVYFGGAFVKLIESIFSAFLATIIAMPFAFLLAFFAARNLTRHHWYLRGFYGVLRTLLNGSRAIEAMIWATLLSVWIGIGPFAGMLALAVHTIASLTKQYSEAIEAVDKGPLEALRAAGSNEIAVAWFAVVPQVLMPYLSFTIYRWDINLRMATIIGMVGGGGIGSILMQEIGLANWPRVGSITLMVCLVVSLMDFISARVREAIQ